MHPWLRVLQLCSGRMRRTRVSSPSSHFASHFSIFAHKTTFHPGCMETEIVILHSGIRLLLAGVTVPCCAVTPSATLVLC
ncbi:hypothetical protein EK904_006439 [Melospiza melodia maxima]|nr:hypothetical protein EK904_006439 [Melospiza melodia maxima]